eukprot:15460236-Alexandrium_andersonii.AAC.1
MAARPLSGPARPSRARFRIRRCEVVMEGSKSSEIAGAKCRPSELEHSTNTWSNRGRWTTQASTKNLGPSLEPELSILKGGYERERFLPSPTCKRAAARSARW